MSAAGSLNGKSASLQSSCGIMSFRNFYLAFRVRQLYILRHCSATVKAACLFGNRLRAKYRWVEWIPRFRNYLAHRVRPMSERASSWMHIYCPVVIGRVLHDERFRPYPAGPLEVEHHYSLGVRGA